MSGSSGDDKRPSRVLEHLYIGSRVHAKNKGLLKELGINRILNVTPARTMDPTNGVPNFFEKDRTMTYKRVAVFDNRGEDLLQHMESCISFIEQGSFYGKVLVHCNKGVSRSSTVVAAYLMRTRGLSKPDAMAYLKSRRSIVNPHEGFLAQLGTFEAKLNSEREAAIADGQEKKFPDDLLNTGRTRAQGPAIGPIGPSRGPSAARNPSRNTSPMRGPTVGPSPPPSSNATGTEKRSDGSGRSSSRSPPRVRAGPIGPSRGPVEPSVSPPAASVAAADGGAKDTTTGAGTCIGAAGPRPEAGGAAAGGSESGGGSEGGSEGGAKGGVSSSDALIEGQEGESKKPAVADAEAAANGRAGEGASTAGGAAAAASIGPAIGPPSMPAITEAGSDALAEGGVEGSRGNKRPGDVDEGCVSSSGKGGEEAANVGSKRLREGETAIDRAETAAQKARMAVAVDGKDNIR